MARAGCEAIAALGMWAALGCACTFDTSGVGPGSWMPRPRDALWLVDAAGGVISDGGGDRPASDHPGGERSEDAPSADASPPSDTLTTDVQLPDVQPPADVLLPDVQLPDVQLPDVQLPDTGPPPCNVQYGHVQGYKFCGETPDSCRFYFAANASCNSACASGGGTCLHAAAERNDSCSEDYPTLCSYVHNDGICTCSR